jgi:hypothetical protein
MTQPASQPLGSTAFESSSGPAAGGRALSLAAFRRVAEQPFVHFTLLGALVFVAHRLLTGTPEPPSIEVSAAKQRELGKLFEQRQLRAPNEAERKQLIQRYVEDEALFREGLRLSLVETDPALRGQLIARVRGLLQSELEPRPPAENELVRYYEEHRADYAIPETIGFREHWIHRGPEAGSDARRMLQALVAGKEPDAELPAATDHVGRSEAQLHSLYGEEVARELWRLPRDRWHELRSERGIHLFFVDRHTAASQPAFAEVRDRVREAYLEDQVARAFRSSVARLTSQWQVKVQGGS